MATLRTHLDQIREEFAEVMQQEIEAMWVKKLGLNSFNSSLVNELLELMIISKIDYTVFFRRLSVIPEDLSMLKESFYMPSSEQLDARWNNWLQNWHLQLKGCNDLGARSAAMESSNPNITWREWLIAPAYEKAAQGDYSLIKELQDVFSNPYKEQSKELESKYNVMKPKQFFNLGGISHYSCSS